MAAIRFPALVNASRDYDHVRTAMTRWRMLAGGSLLAALCAAAWCRAATD
jgi:hypothetical protein